MKKYSARFYIFLVVLILTVLLLFIPLLTTEHYLFASVIFMIGSFFPFFLRFEWKKVTGRELVMLAILAALAAVSRIPFASLPSIQPTTFVIIIAGSVFGAESGFVVGALAAIVSNLFLGQGPWTPWQMYAWGMIGLASGLLKNTWFMKHTIGRTIFGILCGFLFGWIMNLWFVIGIIQDFHWSEIIAYYSASFLFDLAHALSNAFFLIVFAKSWIKILSRFKKKYGLLL
ncbi:ECF transporter S component [Caldibacillus lycopersici]|uniref:ECF transporter S component n=1 Tax=Perspicuibacillus lycopersici TaxID=1325689 RepID=A0AAE3IWK8_9BACI|nr:ECF transporter S component [Perspicuibacillus lycopersici]MCU9613395.1 ECF transporter S component [Perspicuibacillus lycopersici]